MNDLSRTDAISELSIEFPSQSDEDDVPEVARPSTMDVFRTPLVTSMIEGLLHQLEDFPIRRATGFKFFCAHIQPLHRIRTTSLTKKVAHLLWADLDEVSRRTFQVQALTELETKVLGQIRMMKLLVREIHHQTSNQ